MRADAAVIDDSLVVSNPILRPYIIAGRRPFIHALMKTCQDFYDAEIVISGRYRAASARRSLIAWSTHLTSFYRADYV